MPRFSPNQRFTRTNSCTHVNQHSRGSDEDLSNTRYRWLISRTTVVTSPLGLFSCWVVCEGIGIDETKAGYPRMSYAGKKLFTHLFVWEYHNGAKQSDLDISHLCQNKRCCRPSHLQAESRAVNKSRDHCIGFVALDCKSQERTHYRLCKHEPICHTDAFLKPCVQPKEE